MTQVWEGCPGGTHVSVNPERTAGRQPPALLTFLFFKGTVFAELSGPSFLERVFIGCSLGAGALGAAFLGTFVGAGFPCAAGSGEPVADACADWALRALACDSEGIGSTGVSTIFHTTFRREPRIFTR
jgi:hypothetical protein